MYSLDPLAATGKEGRGGGLLLRGTGGGDGKGGNSRQS